MSDRTTRSAASTNNQSRARNPALVSCNTSTGTCCVRSAHRLGRPGEPGRAPRWARPTVNQVGCSALAAEHQRRVTDADHVAVRELPSLHRLAVHRCPVCRTEISEHGTLHVPGDFQVPAGHAGVREPEVGVLAPAHDVAALLELVVPVRTVVQLQARGQLTLRRLHGRRRVTLRGLLRITTLLGVSTLRRVTALLLAVAGIVATLLRIATLLVAAAVVLATLLHVVRVAAVLLLAIARLLLVAAAVLLLALLAVVGVTAVLLLAVALFIAAAVLALSVVGVGSVLALSITLVAVGVTFGLLAVTGGLAAHCSVSCVARW